MLQDFLICIEMLGFSIAHLYAFPTTDEDFVQATVMATNQREQRIVNDDLDQPFRVEQQEHPMLMPHSEVKLRKGTTKPKSDSDLDLSESPESENSDQPLLPDAPITRINNNSLTEIVRVEDRKPTHFQRVMNAFNPKDIVMDVHSAFFVNKESAFSNSLENAISSVNPLAKRQATSGLDNVVSYVEPVPLAVTIISPVQPSSSD